MRADAPSPRWGRVRSEPGTRDGPNKAERRRGGYSTARMRDELTRPMKISSDREGRNCFADRGGAVPAKNRSSFLVAPIFFRDYSAKDAKGYRGRIHAARFGVSFGATAPQRPSATAAIPATVTHTPQTRRGRTRVMSRSMRTVKMTENIGIEAMMGPTTLTSELMMARL